jgi:hypothetical protein
MPDLDYSALTSSEMYALHSKLCEGAMSARLASRAGFRRGGDSSPSSYTHMDVQLELNMLQYELYLHIKVESDRIRKVQDAG